MKNVPFSTLLLTIFSFFTQTLFAQSATDEQAVRQWFEEGFQTYFSGNIEKIMDLYTENAVSIDWMGRQFTGKAAIRQSVVESLAPEAPKPEDLKYGVQQVRFLTPDIATLIYQMSGKSAFEGKTVEWTSKGSMLLNRKSGKWQIELEQSTSVMP